MPGISRTASTISSAFGCPLPSVPRAGRTPYVRSPRRAHPRRGPGRAGSGSPTPARHEYPSEHPHVLEQPEPGAPRHEQPQLVQVEADLSLDELGTSLDLRAQPHRPELERRRERVLDGADQSSARRSGACPEVRSLVPHDLRHPDQLHRVEVVDRLRLGMVARVDVVGVAHCGPPAPPPRADPPAGRPVPVSADQLHHGFDTFVHEQPRAAIAAMCAWAALLSVQFTASTFPWSVRELGDARQAAYAVWSSAVTANSPACSKACRWLRGASSVMGQVSRPGSVRGPRPTLRHLPVASGHEVSPRERRSLEP